MPEQETSLTTLKVMVKFHSSSHSPIRVSKYSFVSTQGKFLLDLCISSGMRILNGRHEGDSNGEFTCFIYTTNGSSVVDYVVASSEIMHKSVRKVTTLITELLKEVRTSQISAKLSRPRSFPRNKWFDMECKTMKRKVNDAKKRFTCHPHVLHLRAAYFMGGGGGGGGGGNNIGSY